MKRLFFFLGLVSFCLTMYGLENTTHNFGTATGMSFGPGNTTATMSDGTLYTCSNGAAFADNNGICISIPRNGEVVVSPAREGLKHFSVSHNQVTNDLSNVQLSVSADGSSWTVISTDDLTRTKSSVEVNSYTLNGDYFVKLKNTYSNNSNIVYVRVIHYFTEPCHCLRVVSE